MSKAKEIYKNRVKRCLYCGKEYRYFPYEEKTTKFCSRSCLGKYTVKTRVITKNTRKKISLSKMGHLVSIETRKKISNTHKKIGKLPPLRTGVAPWNKGIKMKNLSGEKNPKWKGGTWNYQKKFAKERDNFTCQICGLRDLEIMEVDHKKPKCDFPEVMHSLKNLITICPNCHRRKTNKELRQRNFNKSNSQRKRNV